MNSHSKKRCATALISGANRGIGLEFCCQYVQAGWQVIACCRDVNSATQLQNLHHTAAGKLEILPLDVLKPEQIQALSTNLVDRPIDLLINNAGYYGPKNSPFGCIDSDEWMRVLQINTIAPLKLAEALMPQLALCEHATIAMLSSKMGSMDDNHSGGAYIYRSSKAALNAITKSLSIDLAEHGIKAVALHPGWVKTDMGGAHALITAETAVNGLRQVIAQLSPESSGSFFAYDGTAIPW